MAIVVESKNIPTEFICVNNELPVTEDMKSSFEEYGYIIVR